MEALLCDIGNVLVFFSRKRMFVQLADVFNTSPQEIHDQLLAHRVYHDYERGAVSSLELYEKLCELFQTAPSPEDVFRAASEIFTPNEQIYPQIESLRSRGVRLVLLSNISPIHWDYLTAHYPILETFHAKALSYEVGSAKPEPAIYQKAVELSGCAPEQCLYLDDLPEYVEAAQHCGIKGHVYSHEVLESLIHTSTSTLSS